MLKTRENRSFLKRRVLRQRRTRAKTRAYHWFRHAMGRFQPDSPEKQGLTQ